MSLRHAEAVIALGSRGGIWLSDADEWYEALAVILAERAPA